jgi:GNAT superfamily N-acetyltransferase
MKVIKTIINTFSRRNRLLLLNNNNYCGEISYMNKNNTTIISNLYVEPSYQNNSYATKLLKVAETAGINEYLKYNFQNNSPFIYIFKLCAWESLNKPYLVYFYEKRGYDINLNNKTHYYDNQDQIFELIKMSKKIIIVLPTKN